MFPTRGLTSFYLSKTPTIHQHSHLASSSAISDKMAGLLELSPEVMELIISLLDFSAMCNMRLVSRGVSAKATHGIVKSDFEDRRVMLKDASQMKTLMAKTARGWRGCLMDRITVVAVVEPESESSSGLPTSTLKDEDEGATFLCQAFTNLQRHSTRGHLDTLALRVQHRTNDSRMEDISPTRPISGTWDAAARTFTATMRALLISGLPVRRFDVFVADSSVCALACNRLADTLATLDQSLIKLSLSSLTHLNTGMSNALATETYGGLSEEQQPAFALLSLVALCPSLTNLEIRWYNLGESGIPIQQNDSNDNILSQLISTRKGCASLQGLRICASGGIYIPEAALLAFLHNVPLLQDISLEAVHLTEGTFKSIFHCLSKTPTPKDLQRVYLDDLWEAEGTFNLTLQGDRISHPGAPRSRMI